MARLIRPATRDDGARGQMLLVGAFTIALLLVVMAFVLNGAAVTENLATAPGDGHDARDALRYRQAVDHGVSGLVVRVNRLNDSSEQALDSALTGAVADWDGLAASGAAAEGVGTEVRLAGTTNGSRIRQANASRNATDANGNESWTLASGVTETRAFRLNVPRDALATDCNTTCFQVVADNGSATWRASFTRNGTDIVVTVDRPNGSSTCSVTADTARVDLSDGRLAGAPCDPLVFASGVDGPYAVTYDGANMTSGRYELVVDADVANDARYADAGAPSVSPAIYSATVAVTYRTPRLTYVTELRVVPDETDLRVVPDDTDA